MLPDKPLIFLLLTIRDSDYERIFVPLRHLVTLRACGSRHNRPQDVPELLQSRATPFHLQDCSTMIAVFKQHRVALSSAANPLFVVPMCAGGQN